MFQLIRCCWLPLPPLPVFPFLVCPLPSLPPSPSPPLPSLLSLSSPPILFLLSLSPPLAPYALPSPRLLPPGSSLSTRCVRLWQRRGEGGALYRCLLKQDALRCKDMSCVRTAQWLGGESMSPPGLPRPLLPPPPPHPLPYGGPVPVKLEINRF